MQDKTETVYMTIEELGSYTLAAKHVTDYLCEAIGRLGGPAADGLLDQLTQHIEDGSNFQSITELYSSSLDSLQAGLKRRQIAAETNTPE